jgi:hypothetical protein
MILWLMRVGEGAEGVRLGGDDDEGVLMFASVRWMDGLGQPGRRFF